jgi:hypothetical protein
MLLERASLKRFALFCLPEKDFAPKDFETCKRFLIHKIISKAQYKTGISNKCII